MRCSTTHNALRVSWNIFRLSLRRWLLSLLHTSDVTRSARWIRMRKKKENLCFLCLSCDCAYVLSLHTRRFLTQAQDKYKENKIFLFLALALAIMSLVWSRLKVHSPTEQVAHRHHQSRSQSPRFFWPAPRNGADQNERGLWERECA